VNSNQLCNLAACDPQAQRRANLLPIGINASPVNLGFFRCFPIFLGGAYLPGRKQDSPILLGEKKRWPMQLI
jgi:hypothetical protein